METFSIPALKGNLNMELKEQFFQLTEERFRRAPDQCDDKQLYEALLC